MERFAHVSLNCAVNAVDDIAHKQYVERRHITVLRRR